MFRRQGQAETQVSQKSFLYVQPPVYRVKSVQMMHMSDQSVVNQSKTIINNSAATPQLNGGLLDPHLGSMTDTQQCSACNNTRTDCQGHSGRFPLVHPYISPMMMKFVLKILKRLCLNCSLVTGDNKKCMKCGKKALTIKMDNGWKFVLNFDGNDYEYTPAGIKEIFSKLDLNDVKKLGVFFHPEQMILQNVFISPILTRPDKKIQASMVQNDGFTGCLSTIIRVGNMLNKMNPNDKQFEVTYNSFQKAIENYYIDSAKDDYSKSSQKSLGSLIGGKEGTIRNKLMGKQVCKLGRGIIACNTKINADEVIIPQSFAMTVPISEKVQSYNFKRLEKLFKNGPTQYPGANYIRKPNGQKYQIGNSKVVLEIGDTIYRHQQNGDSVLMNRQPTLYAMSIGSHKIQVAKTSNTDTLDLNVISSSLYNFDF